MNNSPDPVGSVPQPMEERKNKTKPPDAVFHLELMQKARQRYRAFLFLLSAERLDLEVHTTHTAHAAATRRYAAAGVLLRYFRYHGFGGDQQRGNRSRVLDRHANHLGRVDDALGDQVAVFAGLRVEAVGILILLEDLANEHRA